MHKIKKPRRNMFVTMVMIGLTLLCSSQIMPLATADDGYTQPRLELDVKITSITFSNDKPDEDEEISISATVWNNGTMNLTNVSVTFSYDAITIGNITNLSIGAKKNITINITWKAVKWDHNISVMVSMDGIPVKDGIMSKEISVEAMPIGDVLSLVIALMIVFLIVIGSVTVPSIWKCITKR